MNKKQIWAVALGFVATSMYAQNQSQDSIAIQALDEVVVSDSRFALKRENSGKTVITISRAEIERNQGRTVPEIINIKSGIEIAGSRGRDGSVLGVFARGGRGRQVLVVIDGVRVSDPSSFSQEYDLRLLSTNAIESIEIIKGAASTLYGTNAATAVINITTKKASKESISADFQATVGTNQTSEDQNYNLGNFANSAAINGTLNRFFYNVDFSNRYSSGISAAVTPENEEDVFSQYSGNLKLGYRFSDSFELSIYGNTTRLDTDFDASGADAPNSLRSDQERFGLASLFKYGKGSVHLNTAFTDYNTNSVNSFGESTFEGKNVVLDIYNKYIIAEKWHTVLGLNYLKDEAVFTNDANFTIVDPYLNVVYVSDFGFNLNTGARLNNHSEYGNHFVYNVNPSYAFKMQEGYVKLLGSYATSYITPNLIQLFGDFGANPDLEPEENRTIEGGVEFALKQKLRVSALYFDRNETNTIGFDPNTFGSINVADEINVNGLELEVNWTPNNKLSLLTNYTYTNRDGDDAIRIPKHKVNVSLDYAFTECTNASLRVQHTGDRIDTVFPPFPEESFNVTLESFTTVDFYLAHTLLENKLKVFLNATNLLNEEFVEIFGFSTRGRNVNLGLALNL